MKNVFYFDYINIIGGVETLFYYLAKKYEDYDITVYFKDGDIEQIKRLRKYIRVKKYNGEKIVCDKIFFNYDISIIDNVEAKEYYEIIHADFKAQKLTPLLDDRLKYIAVSKIARDSFKEITGITPMVMYNPVVNDEPKRVLNLVSATRLSKEKGKSRIEKLGKLLDLANIPYIWTIFTDDINAINNKNIVYMKPRLDVINYIANADYLVQLSDTEAYCYSVLESLNVGTPVIVTDIPCFREIGVVNSKNGYILNKDMIDVPIDDIYNKIPKFNYEPFKDEWEDMLVKSKSTYKEEKNMMYSVKCIMDDGYDDIELKRHIYYGEVFIVNKERAEYLEEKNAVEILSAGVIIEEPKETVENEQKEEHLVIEKPKRTKKNKK